MTMYKGQIFALLGHNGAGKTTTIGMLTGLIESTQGRATLGDLDVFGDMETFRQNLGVCPQHNVLFDTLTVREHLELFVQLKGNIST
jgi:ATP-binding cassette subfamily A (ABC1) protein 3